MFVSFGDMMCKLGSLILWCLCFVAISHGRKPEAFFLLVWALFLTIHVLKKNRGGFMSNVGASTADQAMLERSSLGGFASSVARGVLGLIGSILLTVSILLALSVSVNVPGLFASGVLNPRLPHDLAMAFGTPQWPRLMTESATAVCLVTSVVSMVLLLIARRYGGAHTWFAQCWAFWCCWGRRSCWAGRCRIWRM